MSSRRDLIEGYQFAMRRVVSAVVTRRPDPDEWPFRRLGGAGFGTLMLTVVALGAVAIFGLVFPGGKTSWRDGHTIIVEKETGARFVYIDGRLHPVRNFVSAALLVGSTEVTMTAHASLMGVRRGVELGIDGAPDAIPKPENLVPAPWSLCTEQAPDKTGKIVPRTAIAVGRSPVEGDPPGDQALLVTVPATGDTYIVWHNHRYHVDDPATVGVALGLSAEVNIPVGAAWVQALPAGRSLGPIRPAGAGSPSTAVPGATTGQVVMVTAENRTRHYYLAEADHLRPLTSLQAQIQLAVKDLPAAKEVGASDVAAARQAGGPDATLEAPPADPPRFVRPPTERTTLCAVYRDSSFEPALLVGSAVPAGGGAIPSEAISATGVPLADRVWMPPGKAALVEALASPQAKNGPIYLVTDAGKRFAVAGGDALSSLGYRTGEPSRLPAGLLVRIPEGPPLDPDAARAALANEPDD
jgi:type VII secretion protein EccB